MYDKLKTCLLFPKQIYNYMDEPNKKTVGFLFFLLTLLVIPTCIVLIISKSPSTDVSLNMLPTTGEVVEIKANVINSNLVVSDYDTNNIPQAINGSIYYNGEFPCTYIINNTVLSKNEALANLTIDDIGLYIYYHETGVQLGLHMASTTETSVQTQYVSFFDYTYEELKVVDLELSSAIDVNSENYINQSQVLVDNFYCKVKNAFLPLIILIGIIPTQAESLLFYFLISTVLTLIFVGKFGIKFGKIFKTSILCGLPYVICSIIATFTSLSFIRFIGDIISMIYLYRSVLTYRLIMGRDGENNDVDNTKNVENPEIKIMPGVYVHKENKPSEEEKNTVNINEDDYRIDNDNYDINNLNNNTENNIDNNNEEKEENDL